MRYGHFECFVYSPSRKRACTGASIRCPKRHMPVMPWRTPDRSARMARWNHPVDDYEEWLKAWQVQPHPQPVEPLWSFQHDGHTISCVLRSHAGYGVEAQFLSDGDLRIGRRFETKEPAV